MGEAELDLASTGPCCDKKKEDVMKQLFTGLLLIFTLSMAAQESGHIVMNPLTGELEFVTNPYAIGDSLVNLGYDNNVWAATLTTTIGFGNYLGHPDCIAVGWDNTFNCLQNFALGKNITCNADKVIMIGMSDRQVEAKMPGSVAFCPGGEWAVLHVHSGYGPRTLYSENKGGVRIGQGYGYADGNISLEVYAHRHTSTATGFSTPATARIIATENDEWIVDSDEMTLAGSLSTGYIESPYIPKVHSAAADTSLMPTPLKIGDYFIDTSARDVYISTGTSRGAWRKVN